MEGTNVFGSWVERAGNLMEAVGVGAIIAGAAIALVAVWNARREGRAYRAYRESLGKGILFGLEFLVAADIIRTVSHVPTLREVRVLGLIVVIRTFLSFTLEVELDGRWPWQLPRRSREPRSPEQLPPPVR